jgi:hypothetical protein
MIVSLTKYLKFFSILILFFTSHIGFAQSAASSSPGKVWTAHSVPEANNWRSVTYGNGLFMTVSSTGIKRVMKSQDGITWKARGAPGINECY